MLPLQIFKFPVVSTLYSLFLVIMLVFVLRKHLCTNCYYYGRRCSTGWGKVALLFNKNSGSYRLGIRLAGMTWGLATLIPIIGSAVSLFIAYSTAGIALLVLFVLLSPLNLLIHKRACERCKMRLICPASMARHNNTSKGF